MKELPPTASYLGYAGLMPFIGLSALIFFFPESHHKEFAIFCLLAYGATIVSFLGAIHWGLTMRQAIPNKWLLAWGVVPSLLGWISLLLESELGLLLLATTLWLCFIVDYKIYPKFKLTHWLQIRLFLTFVASVSIVSAIVL